MRRALLLIALLAGTSVSARAQISPGPLSKAHEELDGVTHCRQCHGGGDEGMETKCLECHGEIAWLIGEDRGLHAKEGRHECAKCHPEHAGRDFDLVAWGDAGRDGFDHSRTGWSLEGSHAPLKCDQCHRGELRQANQLLRRPKGSGEQTWLGLESGRCTACHKSPHSERLSTECEGCHRVTKWTDVEKFDHGRTAFALTGRHVKLECVACHQNGKFGTTAGQSLHYFPIASAECSACHKDPHTGRFGPDCAKCHVTSDFHQVPASRFDHARTRFPLRGAHASVKCERCHDPAKGGWGDRPAFAACGDCHTDAHAGTATLAGKVADCAACHDEKAFSPAAFDLARHQQTAYPLEGRHASVDCRKCHAVDKSEAAVARLGRAGIELHPESARCDDCHADAHAGQVTDLSAEASCATCHTVEGWKPSTLDVGWHSKTAFALVGAHARLECRRCHSPERPGLEPLPAGFDPGTAKVALSVPERKCADCHRDVHQGRYSSGARATECTSCHTQDSFVPSTVDPARHDRFGFRLEGAHRATPCFLCHKEMDGQSHLPAGTHALLAEPAPPEVLPWKTPSACQACHRTEVPR